MTTPRQFLALFLALAAVHLVFLALAIHNA